LRKGVFACGEHDPCKVQSSADARVTMGQRMQRRLVVHSKRRMWAY
jgi:hypothetical protein